MSRFRWAAGSGHRDRVAARHRPGRGGRAGVRRAARPAAPARAARPAAPGADLVGRGAALLVDLPVEIAPSGWRLAAHPGRDLRRAPRLPGLGPRRAGGAGRGLRRRRSRCRPPGRGRSPRRSSCRPGTGSSPTTARSRDLAASLAEGLRLHLAEVQRRVPGGAGRCCSWTSRRCPRCSAGRVPTPSGYGTVRAVEASVAEQALRARCSTVGRRRPPRRALLRRRRARSRCCAGPAPTRSSLDASLLTPADYDALGEAVDAGVGCWLGRLPAHRRRGRLDRTRPAGDAPLVRARLRVGARLADVVATPACGLAGASPAYARRALGVLRDVRQERCATRRPDRPRPPRFLCRGVRLGPLL